MLSNRVAVPNAEKKLKKPILVSVLYRSFAAIEASKGKQKYSFIHFLPDEQ